MNNRHTAMEYIHSALSAKASSFAAWLAAGLSAGTLVGWVNIGVGVLSATWLAVQLWNYFSYTLPLNKAKKKELGAHEQQS